VSVVPYRCPKHQSLQPDLQPLLLPGLPFGLMWLFVLRK
jgi:hypothetical protein